MKNNKKSPISGKKISRKEAYKDLGDPKTWEKESKKFYKEFRKRPKTIKESLDEIFPPEKSVKNRGGLISKEESDRMNTLIPGGQCFSDYKFFK